MQTAITKSYGLERYNFDSSTTAWNIAWQSDEMTNKLDEGHWKVRTYFWVAILVIIITV